MASDRQSPPFAQKACKGWGTFKHLGAPVGGGAVDIEADGKGTIGARIAVGDASVTRICAADGTKKEMLIMTECAFG